jgi:signal transduction histidine kinase/CheY-like chemotaxis protein
MDPISFVIELLFALLFLGALVSYLRRRDAVSRDVVFMFGSVASLFVVAGLQAAVGPLPPVVTGFALVLLFAQPLLTLRVVARLRPVPRLVMIAAAAAFAITALPFLVIDLTDAPSLLLGAVGVFVLTNLAVAVYLALEARRRVGAARWRLAAAAVATALFAAALLVSSAGSAGSATESVARDIGRLLGLAVAIGYVTAFLPPLWVRKVWHAVTTFGFMHRIMEVPVSDQANGVWHELTRLARDLTGADAAMVIAGTTNVGVVAVTGPEAFESAAAHAWLGKVPDRLVTGPPISEAGTGLASLAQVTGSTDITTLPFALVGGEPAALVLFERRPSLFASDDHAVLAGLISRAAVLAERAGALAEQAALSERLSVTVTALEHASEAKSDFLASMSHELRTPLSAIIGFSALMRDEPLSDGRRSVPNEWIEHVHRGGEHLLALINDVLDLTKIEAGRIELQRESFELGTALAESVAGLRPLAERKRIGVNVNCASGGVHADRGRLRQIVYNLLSNAIKFTPDGGRIDVEGSWTGQDAHVVVNDTGVGIAADDLDHIFEEFRQVGDIKARETGTGLGLALTRRLVEAHGGRIEVRSQPGSGSRFEVTLPNARVADVPVVLPATDGDVPLSAPGSTILVIEDDPSAVRLLRTYLEAEGYRLKVAVDGESGLLAAHADPPDAVILDLLLPGIDGWEVLRRLKADSQLRDIPVIVLTVVDERNLSMSLGAVDYFLKPVSRDALLRRLSLYTFTTKVKQHPVSILVIDDDPGAREMAVAALRPEGFDVVAAASGREGLALAQSSLPDLVICDLLMPDMDGFEVVSRLQQGEATKEIPILILTGQDLTAADRDRLNGKIAGVVQKNGDTRGALQSWMRRASLTSRARGGAAPEAA